MSEPYLVRFFRTVPPVPPLMAWAFAAAVSVAAIAIVVDHRRAAAALGPILLLQLFAASSGFAVPARRGYYDLLLTRGDGRWRIAMAHWCSSIAPGVWSWMSIAGIELLVSGGEASTLLTSGSCAAMAVLSTLPWAITTTLPRFAGGVGWLLAIAVAVTIVLDGDAAASLAFGNGSASPQALIFLFYPAVVVGQRLTSMDFWTVAPVLALAASSMLAAGAWIARADFPLEAAQ